MGNVRDNKKGTPPCLAKRGVKKLVPREIIPMCTFDLKTKTPTEEITITPRKLEPFLASIGNTVYALSGPNSPLYRVLDPCFESLRLDDDGHKWSPLACASFHTGKDNPKLRYNLYGYAVLENEGFILVCLLHNNTDVQFCSYNTHSNRWKPVLLPAPLPDDDVPPVHHESKQPRLHGQSAAVIGNDIYTYNHASFALRVFSYTKLAGGDVTSPDLSLGHSSFVQGLGCLDLEDQNGEDFFSELCEVSFDRSSAVAKVDGDDILCVLYTLYPSCLELLRVCVNIIQLKQRDQCSILKKFTCFLSVGDKLVYPTIKACFVENLDETSNYPSLKKAVMSKDVDDEASEMDSGDSMIQ